MIKNYVDINTKLDKVNDECGVFGFYKNDDDLDAVAITQDALFGLQHRGQESAGITVNKGGDFYTVKELGMVSEVFTPKALQKLPNGDISVGHVRYTASESLDRASNQPLVLRYTEGSIAIASNGAITNFVEIRKELEHGGAIFQSNSNAELMAYVIATERCTAQNLEDAVLASMDKLKGAYSTVICAPSRLIGFRDMHGFRPLCIGKIKNSYVLSSESCVIDSAGGEFVRDVEPGEMVVIDDEGFHSYKSKVKAEKPSFCLFEYVYVARPDSVVNGVSVHKARFNAGELLYREYPIDADMVCGVPDSGIIAAEGYASASGIPFGMGFVKNKYLGRTVGTGKDKKKRLMQTRLTALKSNVSGKRVVIIDDSIVRGETSRHIVRLMREAGAKEVHMLISSPPFVCPCYFGIDIHDKENLIANKMSVDEICREIGADSLGYLSVDSVHKIASGANIGLCDACFTGSYNAEIPKEMFVDKYAQKLTDTKNKLK
ncbi:MAG: amidophosphoribosyltransferase [Clostridiales bacterium]|nr:amidophosphoribosyltransferase [Clostridiales bacterium]